MGWRDFQDSPLTEKKDLKDLNTKNTEGNELNPFYPFKPLGVGSVKDRQNRTKITQAVNKTELIPENPPPELNILDPDITNKPQLHLLLAQEKEAFDGWYAVMVAGSAEYNRMPLTHEESTLLAWRFLIESMQLTHKEGRGRWRPHHGSDAD